MAVMHVQGLPLAASPALSMLPARRESKDERRTCRGCGGHESIMNII